MPTIKTLSWLFFIEAVVILLVLISVLYSSLPEYSTSFDLPDVKDSIEILRDQQAVPHIYAKNELDAYFALGFVHAQDRLWQMELNLRAASGMLAEWFGHSMLTHDRFHRSLGLSEIVEKDFYNLDEKTRAILNAYALGINTFRKEMSVLPPEYLFLSTQPHTWKAHDSLLILKYMGWQLSRNYWDELLYVALNRQLSTQEMQDLFPSPHKNIPLLHSSNYQNYSHSLAKSAESMLKKMSIKSSKDVGSNNWVVAGSRTMDGKPLLANDPHLKLSIPTTWYAAHISTPQINIVGATLPGIPAILLGKNDYVAWAFTNTGADSQDLFLERFSSIDDDFYETPNGEKPLDIHTETIKVRGMPDEQITIRRTRHGPVISDHDEEIQSLMPNAALSLNWTGFHSHDLSLQFFHKAAYAQSAQEFLQASRDYHAPLQNIIYADVEGSIGLITAGRNPIRAPNNDLHGRIPALGWLQDYDWQGFIPFEHLPQQYNPYLDYIITANHNITPEEYPYLIAHDWAPPYRFNRINELIGNRHNHDISTSQSIQLDAKSTVAEQLLPILLRIQTDNPTEQDVLSQLQQWDLVMRSDAPQPLIFIEWTRQLTQVLLKNKLADLYELIDSGNSEFLIHVLTQPEAQERWCTHANSEATPLSSCEKEIKAALRFATAALNERYGANRDRWTWRKSHISTAQHPLFGQLPVLNTLFNVITARDGGRDTVNVSGYIFDEKENIYKEEVAPIFRAIYDLANPNYAIFSLSSGQSGHFLSPYYKNLSTDWVIGNYFRIYTHYDTINKSAIARLTINPAEKPIQTSGKSK